MSLTLQLELATFACNDWNVWNDWNIWNGLELVQRLDL